MIASERIKTQKIETPRKVDGSKVQTIENCVSVVQIIANTTKIVKKK